MVDRIALMFKVCGAFIFLGWGQAVLFIEVPRSTCWFSAIHQDIESDALLAIEIFHEKRFLFVGPLLKECARSQEEIVINEGEAMIFQLLVLGKR